MRPATTLFFDVDTQRDFILPDGRLYAKGAERIIPTLEAITRLARDLGVRIAGSVDRHFPSDAELARNGGLYPDHCMDGTEGQCKIDQTAPVDPVFVENRDLGEAEAAAAIAHRGEVFIEKQDVDVFNIKGNRNTQRLVAGLLKDAADVVIYGVCTDICVDCAVRGMLKYGRRLHVVTDAIAPLDAERADACLRNWRAAGVELLTFAELKSRLASRC
jgi:nicotinamidase/pyrazinamidase